MVKISLPTDLCRVMLRDRLSPLDQLAFLQLVINRQINMSGVYQSDDLDCLHIIQSAGLDAEQAFKSFSVLTERGWLWQDQDIVFIPMVPYVSLYHKHARKIAMHRSVMKFLTGREDNRALLRYAQYMHFWDKYLSYDSPNADQEGQTEADQSEPTQSSTTQSERLPRSAQAELERLSAHVPNIDARLSPLEIYTLRYITDPSVRERISQKQANGEPTQSSNAQTAYPTDTLASLSSELLPPDTSFSAPLSSSSSSSSSSESSLDNIPLNTLERGGAGERARGARLKNSELRSAATHGEKVLEDEE